MIFQKLLRRKKWLRDKWKWQKSTPKMLRSFSPVHDITNTTSSFRGVLWLFTLKVTPCNLRCRQLRWTNKFIVLLKRFRPEICENSFGQMTTAHDDEQQVFSFVFAFSYPSKIFNRRPNAVQFEIVYLLVLRKNIAFEWAIHVAFKWLLSTIRRIEKWMPTLSTMNSWGK